MALQWHAEAPCEKCETLGRVLVRQEDAEGHPVIVAIQEGWWVRHCGFRALCGSCHTALEAAERDITRAYWRFDTVRNYQRIAVYIPPKEPI